MSDTIDKAHITHFRLNYERQVQQMMSKLEGTCTIDQHQGKRKRYTIQEPIDYVTRTGRLQNTPSAEHGYDFRWLLTAPYHAYRQWDRDDEFLIDNMTNPNSPLQQEMGSGWGRLVDDVKIAALGANVTTGENGTASTAYAGNEVAVNYVESGSPANSNLTLPKMRRASELFNSQDVDPGLEKYWLIGPSQLNALQRINEYNSLDYHSKRGLETGQPTPFLGFTFILTNRLQVETSDVRTTWIYTKRALVFNPGVREVDFSIRTDMRNDRQLYSYVRLGAMRLYDEEVCKVFCDETV